MHTSTNFRSVLATLLLSLLLGGCASLAMDTLAPGVATEAFVRGRLGEPGRVWPPGEATPGAAVRSAKTLEYSNQPYGHTTYMLDIGADGKLTAVRQVLSPENFATITAGLPLQSVLRALGKPLNVSYFARKKETLYEWRYRDGPNWGDSKIFMVTFDAAMQVLATASMRDPDLDPKLDPTGGLFDFHHGTRPGPRFWPVYPRHPI